MGVVVRRCQISTVTTFTGYNACMATYGSGHLLVILLQWLPMYTSNDLAPVHACTTVLQ